MTTSTTRCLTVVLESAHRLPYRPCGDEHCVQSPASIEHGSDERSDVGDDCGARSNSGLTRVIVGDSNASYGVRNEQKLPEFVRRLRSSQNGVEDGLYLTLLYG